MCDDLVIAIEIIPVNDAPQLVLNGEVTDSLEYITLKNTPLEFCLDVNDIENDNVFVQSIELEQGSDSQMSIGDNLCLLYTPASNFIGEERMEVFICDTGDPSKCTKVYVGIVVEATNDPPVITSQQDTIYVDVLENNSIDVCLEVSDPDQDDLAFNEITELLNVGGTTIPTYPCLNYTPPLNFTGLDLLHVQVCDDVNPALCDDVVIKINVIPVNNPPIVIENSIPTDTVYFTTKKNVSILACLEIIDPDGNNAIITEASLVNNVGSVLINSASCIDFTPENEFTGTGWVLVTICDDVDPNACSQVIVEIEVEPTNLPPMIVSKSGHEIDSLFLQTAENEEIEFCLDVVDPEDDEIQLSEIEATNPAGFYLPGQGDLCFIFVPNKDEVGKDGHLITICDTGNPQGCDSIYVEIEILPKQRKSGIV